MDLETYQPLAVSTAMPTALGLDHLIPMIVGEVGELFGAQARAVRDDWTAEALSATLAKEYGDIAWGTAVLLHVMDIHSEDELGSPAMFRPVSPWQRVLDRANDLHYYSVQSAMDAELRVREAAKSLWLSLESYCQDITGQPFSAILEANVAKLQDRAARGVLQGSGDTR